LKAKQMFFEKPPKPQKCWRCKEYACILMTILFSWNKFHYMTLLRMLYYLWNQEN